MSGTGEERASRYQRLRLWCGIAGIGGVLGFLWLVTLLGLPVAADRVLGAAPPELAGAATALLLGVVASLIQAVPDAVAINVERRFGQRRDGVIGPYVARLIEWLLGLFVAGGLVGLSVRIGGDLWWLAAAAGLLALAGAHVAWPLSPGPTPRGAVPQEWWRAVRAELERMGLPTPRVEWYDHGERSLAGGWHGVGPLRRLFVARSLWDVAPPVAASLIAREIGHLRLGHRAQTMLATALTIVICLALAGLFASLLDARSAAGRVVVTATVVSSGCWVSLLGLWPALGRRQVLAADRFAAERGDGRAMLDALSDHNLPDPSLPAATAFVFHPIPPMDRRRAALERVE